ncbi:hypothetical protein [Flavobacterium sp. '19STA2R22 D10 B1']|uniref:hypothetical protein n=1 Tax=Flavobacterium aerium TaxID=3037261 RepID=UPI00278C5339|nr:hypothetical protein [Flavobacterium sp. '19STA2R22 D10 B1']
MKGLDFNYFFGYEKILNQNPEVVLGFSFLGVVGIIIGLTILSYPFKKMKIITRIMAPLMFSLLSCLFIGIVPIMILFFIAPEISGVKLAYIWLTIFLGITLFWYVNYATLLKFGEDLQLKKGKKIKEKR